MVRPDDGSCVHGERSQILLFGFGRAHDELAGRVVLLGYRTLRASALDAAVDLLRRQAQPVRASMFPPDATFDARAAELKRLNDAAGPLGLRLIVSGSRPKDPELCRLKRDGVRFCLWRPFNDSELRFVLNAALYDDMRGQVRPSTRVPTSLIARVKSAAGEKPGMLYNLSSTGAFVETLRPNLPGGRIVLTIDFPDGAVATQASVVFANAPGNLQRPNVPIGMGVRFEGLTPPQADRISSYVAERIRAYEL